MLQGFTSEAFELDDGRCQFPEEIKARAPRGSRAQIRRAAESEGVSAGELIRRAIMAYIGSDKNHREPRAA